MHVLVLVRDVGLVQLLVTVLAQPALAAVLVTPVLLALGAVGTWILVRNITGEWRTDGASIVLQDHAFTFTHHGESRGKWELNGSPFFGDRDEWDGDLEFRRVSARSSYGPD